MIKDDGTPCMSKQVITTFSCALNKCPVQVSTNTHWIEYFRTLKKWGWVELLTVSPWPRQANAAWAIRIYFCPEHSWLASNSHLWTIGLVEPNMRASYVVRLQNTGEEHDGSATAST